MEFADELIILVFVLQAIYSLYQRMTGGRQAEEAAELEAPPAQDDRETWAVMLDRARDQIDRAEDGAARLRERAARLRDRLGLPALAPLRAAVERHLLPPIDRLRERLADLSAHLDDVDERPERVAHWFARSAELGETFGALAALEGRFVLLDGAARWLGDADLARLVREAEAVAAALLAPLAAGDHRWPQAPPICLPAPRDDLDVGALFPDRPVVLLPPAFADEARRWPALVDAVARTILRVRPGLLAGPRSLLPGEERAWLPRLQGRVAVFDLDAAGRAWLPTLAADTLAVMMMGPAALRGAMRRLASPDDPDAVTRVEAGADPRLVDETPPPHLRVELMAHTLAKMGATGRAEKLLAQWRRTHDHPEALRLPSLFGESVRLPVARAVERLAPVVDRLRAGRHDALGGRPLSAMPGFEMGPGRWARVRRRVEALVGGQRFHDDPRVAVAAAIVAADRLGGFGPRLSRALRDAILAADERRLPDPNYHPASPRLDAPLVGRELIEAVALRAAWRRPHRHPSAPKRWARG
ncbi:MAG: hypothetical protein R3F65_26155 [bacterium]